MDSLVKREQNNLQTMEELTEVCNSMIKGGFLPAEIKTVQQAVAIAIKGRDLGISASQALSEIYVVKGKASLKAELTLQLAMERVVGFCHEILELSPEKCVVKYSRAGKAPFTYTYTMEMAKNAELTGNPVWKKYPDYMLFNRNVSFALKMYCPDYKNPLMELDIASLEVAEQAIEELTGKKPETKTEAIEGEFREVNTQTGEVVGENNQPEESDIPQEETLDAEVVEDTQSEVKNVLKCEECGIEISEKVSNYSRSKVGKDLCYKCQRGGK